VPSCRSGRWASVSSAWWELTMRRPASIIRRAQSARNHRAEASATRKYRKGDSGQPCRMPACRGNSYAAADDMGIGMC
jgi:hypothetical protein